MSASRESDSVASRPINASLIPFKREAQEANLIGRLRQKAGPAVIDCVVRTLIEATYASTLLPTGSKYRNVNLVDLVTAVDYKPTQRLYTFVEAYIHVIKHDLGKLGYTLSLVPHGLKYYSGQNYQSVVLGACNSGSTSTTLESLVTGSSWGPALRVSDNS